MEEVQAGIQTLARVAPWPWPNRWATQRLREFYQRFGTLLRYAIVGSSGYVVYLGLITVVYEMGLPVQIHAGCQTLIDIIKEQQPLLGLHGHIHEGRAKINIGKTICINPGSVYPEGILQGALITLRDGQVTQANLMQG